MARKRSKSRRTFPDKVYGFFWLSDDSVPEFSTDQKGIVSRVSSGSKLAVYVLDKVLTVKKTTTLE